MLTCMARSKQPGDESLNQPEELDPNDTAGSKQAMKSLTSQANSPTLLLSLYTFTQMECSVFDSLCFLCLCIFLSIKDMALKASGAYRNCNPCTGPTAQQRVKGYAESSDSASASERFRWSYRRTASSNSSSTGALKGISSSGERTPASASGRRPDPIVFVEESEPKEWVAQVEPGVLITFVSMPRGGNDLKRIRFSREMFNKWQAQRWWTENYDKVMELYNVQRLNRQAFPLPTPPRSEDESTKIESAEDSPVTPPLSRERLPRTMYRPLGNGMGYSSSDSFEQHTIQSRYNYDSALNSTPKLSSISGAKTETSSVDASIRTSSSREADRSGELSISNASDLETEWVEQDEPGVYITIRALPGVKRNLDALDSANDKLGWKKKRDTYSSKLATELASQYLMNYINAREKFGEVHARLWWEENRARIHKQYL
ncbi:hypothetical protein NMG60_11013555 [Bertholletia excelsa]